MSVEIPHKFACLTKCNRYKRQAHGDATFQLRFALMLLMQ
jgi:hypothetical protein